MPKKKSRPPLLSFGTPPAQICQIFIDTLNSELKVPRAPKFETPMLGELYWLDSKLGADREAARVWKLKRHDGRGIDPTILAVTSPAKKSTCVRLRVRSRVSTFVDAITVNAQKVLNPQPCVDHTNFGVECESLTLEGAKLAGQACAKLLNSGALNS